MPLQSLIFTALPNGLSADGKSLKLSVLVSPRLEPQTAPARLDAFADFVSWPTTLAAAKFTVKLGTKTVTLAPADVDGALGKADPKVWAALFAADTFVRAFVMRDHSNDVVVSYDTSAMNALVAGVYGKLTAEASDDLPTLGDLRADPQLSRIGSVVGRLDATFFDKKKQFRDVDRMFGKYREDRFKGVDGPGAPLGAFSLFHTPPSKPTTQTNVPKPSEADPLADPRADVTWQTYERAKLDAAKAVKELDFHQIVAAMNQYPTLLRRLGIVVDLLVPRATLATGTDLSLSVSVELPPAKAVTPASRVVTRRSASPVTHTRYTVNDFAPVPRPTSQAEELRVTGGLLRTDADRFAVLQADVDGSGLKLINFTRTLGRHVDVERQVDPVTKLPRRTGAPALRNAGLMLVHKGRGPALTHAFKRAVTLNTGMTQAFSSATAPAPQLWAEDLVRGWRVDVWDATAARWRSLCERVAEYKVGVGATAITMSGLREETTVRLAATSSADGNNPGVTYLHEALTVWHGWSLAARQPGLAVDTDDSVGTDPAAEVPDGIRLRSSFVPAPGSLPRLRYGRAYAMRARVVDLAGNSLAPTPTNIGGPDTVASSAPTPYFRFEPVQPPTIALVKDGINVEGPLEGESMARLAVRTFNDQFDDPAASGQVARRWGVAPRVSQREAELHGALDGAAWGTPAQYALLSQRDKELGSVEISLPGPLADPDVPVPPATYATLAVDATTLPYLPDPLCTRVAARLIDHPSASSAIIPIPLYIPGTAWPDVAPFFIRVYEATGEVPRWDDASRTLLVPTPKATRAKLRLSAMLDTAALDLMGVWSWVPAATRTTAFKRRAQAGQLWPLTPWRELEVVHAVQRPLLRPTIDAAQLYLDRPLGATFVRPYVDARVHRMSTERVDLRAAWHEPKETETSAAPVDVAKTDVACTVKITDPQGYGGIPEHAVPVPTDPDRILFGPGKPGGVLAPATLPVKLHDFGDTRYRRVEYHLVGSSRFREYMPPALLVEETENGAKRVTTDEHVSLAGPVVRTWAPNAAPPPAPEVLYIVPTFGWTRGTDASGKATRWRRGGGLRVWLGRPWNATGYGEMLAVALPPVLATVEPNDPPYKHTVTQWGNDPIWASPFVAGTTPKLADFRRARTAPDPTGAWIPPGAPATEADQPPGTFKIHNLPHAGLARGATAGLVDIAPHDVFWDADRRLWYCDIEIDHGAAYFPFVRLALARYQPSSLAGTHLSNVVIADFAALAPDRWLSVSRADLLRRQVTVYGLEPTESSGYHEAWPLREQVIDDGKITTIIRSGIGKSNVTEVWLEQLAPSGNPDFGWRRIADGMRTVTMTAAPKKAASRTAASTEAASATAGATVQLTPAARAARAKQLVQQRDYDLVVSESLLEATMEWPTLWSGSVTLPATAPRGTRHRVVVAEYEEYLADDADPYSSPIELKGRRLVFLEHVELT